MLDFRLWAHDTNYRHWKIFHYCICGYWSTTHDGVTRSLRTEIGRTNAETNLLFRIQIPMLWISIIQLLCQIHSSSHSYVRILDIHHDHSSIYILGDWVSWMGFDGCILLRVYKCDNDRLRRFGSGRSSKTQYIPSKCL